MRNRIVGLARRHQLWLHHHYREIKLGLLAAIGVMVFLFAVVSLSRQDHLISQVKTLSEQNKTLSEENQELNLQTKQLSEQNTSIGKQNREYLRCLAQIFARYTQTFQPIMIGDLDSCTIDVQNQVLQKTPASETTNSRTANPGSTPENEKKPTTKSSSGTSTPPPGGSNQTPNCTIDVLFLHLGCGN